MLKTQILLVVLTNLDNFVRQFKLRFAIAVADGARHSRAPVQRNFNLIKITDGSHTTELANPVAISLEKVVRIKLIGR